MPQSRQKLDAKSKQSKINASLASYVKGVLARMDQLETMIMNVNKRLCALEQTTAKPNDETS